MDPLTHTLLGSQLSASGLGRTSSLATATLLVAVNLPDIDFVTYFVDGDLALEWRRGITHGIFAMVVLPLLLTTAMVLFHFVRQRFRPDTPRPPLRPLALLMLASIGVLSHPLLDWLNTYGVRLLAPRKDRWFYGDVLFIIDPWIWLLLGGAAWLRYGTHRRGQVLCLTVAGLMTVAVVLGSPSVLGTTLWIAALLGVLAARRSSRLVAWAASGRLAMGAIFLAATYVLLLMMGDGIIKQQVRQQLLAKHTAINGMMVGPTPVNPLRRDVIVRIGDRYTFGTFDWLSSPQFQVTDADTRLLWRFPPRRLEA